MANKKEKVIAGLKVAGEFVSSGCAQALICGVARAILPPGVGTVVKGAVLAGGLLVGAFVGDKMGDFVDEQIDEKVKDLEDTVSEIKRNLDVIRDKDLEKDTE